MDSDAEKKFMKELGNALKEERLIVGVEKCVKALKTGTAQVIAVSNNCPYTGVIRDAAKGSEAEIVELDQKNNVALGELCKKPFRVSVATILSSPEATSAASTSK